jgi:hypothetical protein
MVWVAAKHYGVNSINMLLTTILSVLISGDGIPEAGLSSIPFRDRQKQHKHAIAGYKRSG